MAKTIEEYHAHLFGEWEKRVHRSKERIKQTGEVFTPTWLVNRMLDKVGPDLVEDPAKRAIDTSCGDGQFLAAVLYRRLQAGVKLIPALSTIYGVELMPDNAKLCRERLACGDPKAAKIAERNIVCADARYYHMRFDGSPYNHEEAVAAREQELRLEAKAEAFAKKHEGQEELF